MTDQNPSGGDPTGGGKAGDPTNKEGTGSLKGKVDKQGVPLDAEERADYYQKLSADNHTKFQDSSRGVEGLLNKNKDLETENERLKTQSPHKEDKVSREEFSQLEKRQEETEKQQRMEANKRVFNTQCKNLFEQDEFKNIKSLRAEFEEYAYEEDNLNVPIEILARSFQVVKGLLKSESPKEGDEGREGIEGGTGGSRHQPPAKKGYTSEQVENMRLDDPKKYNRLSREGKLNIVD